MYKISVSTKFGSAHNLRNYGGKCERLHGHTWKVRVSLRAMELSEQGFLRDFKDVKAELNKVIEKFDHSYLNEVVPFDKINPTAENLAKHIFDELYKVFPELYKVSVWESENAKAVYSI